MGVMDDILGKQPEQRTAEFIMDRQVREALSEAQMRLEQAKHEASQVRPSDANAKAATDQAVNDWQEKVDDLLERAKASLIRFTFDALDPEQYDELKGLKEHRPTDAQKDAARKANARAPEWNVKTFPPAAVAAACVKIETPSGEASGLTLEEAQAIWSSRAYNAAELGTIFDAALGATLTRTRVDLPKAG